MSNRPCRDADYENCRVLTHSSKCSNYAHIALQKRSVYFFCASYTTLPPLTFSPSPPSIHPVISVKYLTHADRDRWRRQRQQRPVQLLWFMPLWRGHTYTHLCINAHCTNVIKHQQKTPHVWVHNDLLVARRCMHDSTSPCQMPRLKRTHVFASFKE